MFTFDEKPNRHSIRLPHYDYSDAGYYFVTICAHQHRCLFGKAENGKIIHNRFGLIVQNFLGEIPARFKNVALDEFIVMPNHMHMIVIIKYNVNKHS